MAQLPGWHVNLRGEGLAEVVATGPRSQGGLGLRIKDKLIRSGFDQRFVAKGRFQGLMSSIPVKLITHPQPGLYGAAAAFAQASVHEATRPSGLHVYSTGFAELGQQKRTMSLPANRQEGQPNGRQNGRQD